MPTGARSGRGREEERERLQVPAVAQLSMDDDGLLRARVLLERVPNALLSIYVSPPSDSVPAPSSGVVVERHTRRVMQPFSWRQ